MVWTPPTEEAEYYNLTCPADQLSTLSQLLVPFLGPGADPTFGRAALPRSPDELKIRSEYKSRDGTIPTDGEVGKEWVAYQAWERKDGIDDRGAPGAPSSRWLLQETDPIRGAKWGYRTGADESTNPSGDILVIHGLNDYGGRFSSHVRKFLDDGVSLDEGFVNPELVLDPLGRRPFAVPFDRPRSPRARPFDRSSCLRAKHG